MTYAAANWDNTNVLAPDVVSSWIGWGKPDLHYALSRSERPRSDVSCVCVCVWGGASLPPRFQQASQSRLLGQMQHQALFLSGPSNTKLLGSWSSAGFYTKMRSQKCSDTPGFQTWWTRRALNRQICQILLIKRNKWNISPSLDQNKRDFLALANLDCVFSVTLQTILHEFVVGNCLFYLNKLALHIKAHSHHRQTVTDLSPPEITWFQQNSWILPVCPT